MTVSTNPILARLNPTTWLELNRNNICVTLLTKRGTTGGTKRHIPVISTPRLQTPSSRRICYQNLTTIPVHAKPKQTHRFINSLDCCLVNSRSLRNKSTQITDFVNEHDLDMIMFTETWLRGDESDHHTMAEITPLGYKLHHIPRTSRMGGGVAVMSKTNLKIAKEKQQLIVKSFEYMQVHLSSDTDHWKLIIIYRPPPSQKNKFTASQFFDEFTTLLSYQSLSAGKLLIAGDFNFHMDNKNDIHSAQLNTILETTNLIQHVAMPTHHKGHILDLLITRSSDDITDIIISDPAISDHYAVIFKLPLTKPCAEKKSVTSRKYKDIDITEFYNDLRTTAVITSPASTVSALITQYNSSLLNVLDRHAPEIRRTVTIRQNTKWFTEEVASMKRERRKAERRWRNTQLTVHKHIYLSQCKSLHRLINSKKTEYYSTLLEDNQSDQKSMFTIINTLLHRKHESPLPKHDSTQELTNRFAKFFAQKIQAIWTNLHKSQPNNRQQEQCRTIINPLKTFQPATRDEVKDIVNNSANKSCGLDPIPTFLVKKSLDVLLPSITTIVNSSLSTGHVPALFKLALVSPLLKKSHLDPDVLKNYRPVSNLTFLSKVTEKVVAKRLISHLHSNSLIESMQSAYKQSHSTETALIRVQNDILMALDQQKIVMLVLLDLSAAFDTVDHSLLLERMSSGMGVADTALSWFESYLSDRQQKVCIRGSVSSLHKLKYGVPQGSVLGPILFTVYTSPLGDVIRHHNINFHLYADDTQLYLCFKTKDIDINIQHMESAIKDIHNWLTSNFLKLNSDKTELLLFGSRPNLAKLNLPSIQIEGCTIVPTTSARDLGIEFDKHMTMDNRVNSICKSSYFHIRNISSIRKYLTNATTKHLVHSFVTSRIDHGNSLLYGIAQTNIRKLQLVQNTAARLITRTKKFDHITEVLYNLHWLPVQQRINFKIMLIAFRAIHNTLPSYICELFASYKPTRSLRSTNKLLLNVPKINTKSYGQRAICHAAPALWNELPLHIKLSDNIDIFKRKLKTHLFKQTFETQ